MGQKTHPIGLRLGIVKGWSSNWYGGNNYAERLVDDETIRNYLNTRLPKGAISKIVIERTPKRLIITIHTARPGIVIGKGGQEVERLKEEIKEIKQLKLSVKEVQINIFEVKRPEIDAKLVAENVAQQLRARISFRRAMKAGIAAGMRMGAGGIKIMCSGRLGGAEMARTEQYKEGRVPLQTLRADIDYATATAQTVYGAIGIKVWVFNGELYGKVDLSPNASNAVNHQDKNQRGANAAPRPGFGAGGERRERREGGGGGDRRGGGGGNAGGGAGRGAGERRPRK